MNPKTKYIFKIQDSFRDCCPLCKGINCIGFLGTYDRNAVSSSGTFYEDFSILRFRCHEKGIKNSPHKTFSLLPYELIPYTKYSIDFMFIIANSLYVLGKSKKTTVDDASKLLGSEFIPPVSMISKIKEYIIKAIDKVIISGYYPDLIDYLNTSDIRVKIKSFLKYLTLEYGCPIRGPCKMSYEYYDKNGKYKNNGSFLFGTPSQMRIKRSVQ